MPDDPVLQQALSDLDSADGARRVDALQRLLQQNGAAFVPRVIPLLHDADASIRRLAVQVLGHSGSAAAVQPLIGALDDVQADIRAAAASALGLIKDRAAVQPLIQSLYDEAVEVRFAAASALGLIGDARAVFDLIKVLDNDDMPLALAAAQALHRIGTPEALAAIQHLHNGQSYEFEVPGEQAAPSTLEDTLRHIPPGLMDQFQDAEEAERSQKEAQQADPVQFSAYCPREAVPEAWSPLRAYVFRASAADAVSADAAQQLGDAQADYHQVVRPAQGNIAEGALITATPELPGFQFNPPSASINFYEDWQRFDFKLRAVTALLDQAANGKITFTVEGVIVADVPLSVYVRGSMASGVPPAPVTRPLYEAVFCSYSHQDTQIVERVERAYKALGLDFLRDVVSLRSGENWSDELLRLIDRADIFQLFWSQASSQSQHVQSEWMHALSLKRPEFIRPVYWQQPLPPIPSPLEAIHFAYAPDLGD